MLDDDPTSEKYSYYVSGLDEWLDEMVLMNHHDSKTMVAQIKSRYANNMKANIQYHSDMARTTNEQKRAQHHRLMAQLYRALLPAS